jgi:hypothetical protein
MLSKSFLLFAILVAAFFAVFAGPAMAGNGTTVVTPQSVTHPTNLHRCSAADTFSPFSISVGWTNPTKVGDRFRMLECAGNNTGLLLPVVNFTATPSIGKADHNDHHVDVLAVAGWSFRTVMPTPNTVCPWSGTPGYIFDLTVSAEGGLYQSTLYGVCVALLP